MTWGDNIAEGGIVATVVFPPSLLEAGVASFGASALVVLVLSVSSEKVTLAVALSIAVSFWDVLARSSVTRLSAAVLLTDSTAQVSFIESDEPPSREEGLYGFQEEAPVEALATGVSDGIFLSWRLRFPNGQGALCSVASVALTFWTDDPRWLLNTKVSLSVVVLAVIFASPCTSRRANSLGWNEGILGTFQRFGKADVSTIEVTLDSLF